MSKRNVTLKLTTQKDLIVVESDARTFGELKKQLTNIKWDGMRVVERTTKNTLQMDDAVLPATDFVLFLVPEKVKSGAVKKINVETASYNDLRSHISMLNKVKNAGISMNGKVEDLRKALKKFYAKDVVAAPKTSEKEDCKCEESTDPIAIIEECRVKINEAIDAILENARMEASAPVDTTEYVFKTSIEDLEKEVSDIKSCLKL